VDVFDVTSCIVHCELRLWNLQPHDTTEIQFSLQLCSNIHFSRRTWVSRYQNVSIMDFIGAKGDGGGADNYSYKMASQNVTSNKSTPGPELQTQTSQD